MVFNKTFFVLSFIVIFAFVIESFIDVDLHNSSEKIEINSYKFSASYRWE